MKRVEIRPVGRAAISAFTLIELLVVVAIIAVLISILLPSLNAARQQARAVQCGANIRQVGQAMAAYLAESKGTYPAAYIYPYNNAGNYSLVDQPSGHPYGYIHWSWFLYNRGQVGDAAFICPNQENAGHPRTNPGPDGQWNGNQVDQNGGGPPGSLKDRQAQRMAFTGNAAVFPRNKFTTDLSGGVRKNRFVNESEIKRTADVILAAEFQKNFKPISIDRGSGYESKSHRSVNPFQHLSSGSNEYAAPLNTPGFTYGGASSDYRTFGLRPQASLENQVGVIEGVGYPETNAIGRHHPGNDRFGGTGNFLYVDGHVERTFVFQTLKNRKWGEKYYAIDGRNEVLDWNRDPTGGTGE